MNLSINLLSDYESLYHVIVKDVLKHKREECSKDAPNDVCSDMDCKNIYTLDQNDFKCYITLKNQNSYLKKVYKKIDEIENDNNIIDIQHQNIKNKEKVIEGYTGIIIFILSMIILYYLYIIYVNVNVGEKAFRDNDNIKGYIAKYNMRSLYCNNINIIAVLIYLARFANNYQTNEINKLDNEKKKLNKINDTTLSNINTAIDDLKDDKHLTNGDLDDNNISNISTKLHTFITEYKEAEDQTNNNKLMKEKKIKDINHLFTDFKHIIYKQENNFKDVIIDNSTQIHCLMNLIINRKKCSDEIEAIKCSLNNKCGIEGLIDVNSKSGFNNNTENMSITDDEIDIFFNKIKKETFNKNSKYELNNLYIFKVIKNIFISKIYHNEIEKSEFIKFIYNHFDKVNLKDENIEINKFDIILNYKSIINIIYSDYEIYKKTENKDKHKKIGNIISKSRFNHILKYYTTDQLKELDTKLKDTITKIDTFKRTFEHEIYEDIESQKNTNQYINDFSKLIISISVIDFACYLFEQLSKIATNNSNKNNNTATKITPEDTTIIVLETVRRLSFIILVNMIIFSYHYKIKSITDIQELIIKNNNDVFSTNLENLREKMNNMIIIKNIDDYENKQDELDSVLQIYSIESDTKNDKRIFSRYNSGNNYTILDEDDITNIVIEDFYNNLIEVMRLYECCSFLNRNPKVPIFPWTEFTINIIFVAITLLVATQLLISFNPMDLIEKIKETIDSKVTQRINNMDGGGRMPASHKSVMSAATKIGGGVKEDLEKRKNELELKGLGYGKIKELEIKGLGYGKIKELEKRKNETKNILEKIKLYREKYTSKINNILLSYAILNKEIKELKEKKIEIFTEKGNNVSSIIDSIEKNIIKLENNRNIRKDKILTNIKKYTKEYNETTKKLIRNKDIDKIFENQKIKELFNEKLNFTDELIEYINSIESMSTDDLDDVAKEAEDDKDELLQNIEKIDDKIIKEYFEDVLEKEYSINKKDLEKMEKVIKEINEKREQNSPENYELNAKYLLNGVIISLSLYYSYNIYWSTMEHQKNLYRI